MKPLRLKLSNLMSHKNTEIDLAGIRAACIQGDNGAGKSGLLDGILYALFGQTSRGTGDSLVKIGETEMSAVFDFIQAGRCYRASRKRVSTGRGKSDMALGIYNGGGPSSLDVIATGDAVTGSVMKILGRDFKTFTASSFLLQGQQEKIILATPKERFQIVFNILGLDRYSKYKEAFTRRKNRLTDKVSVIEEETVRLAAEIGDPDELLKSRETLQQTLVTLCNVIREKEALLTSKSSGIAVLRSKLGEFEAVEKEIASLEKSRAEAALRKNEIERKAPAFPDGKQYEGYALMEKLSLQEALSRVAEIEASLKNSDSLKKQAESLESSKVSLQSGIQDAEQRVARYRKVVDNKEKILSVVEQEKQEKDRLKALKVQADSLQRQLDDLNAAARKASEIETAIAVSEGKIKSQEKERLANLKAAQERLANAEREASLLGKTVCKGEGEYSSCVLIAKAVESRVSTPSIRDEIEKMTKRPAYDEDAQVQALRKQLSSLPADAKQRVGDVEKDLASLKEAIKNTEAKLDVMSTWTRQATEIENAEKEISEASALIASTKLQIAGIEKRITTVRAEVSGLEPLSGELSLVSVVAERLKIVESTKAFDLEISAIEKNLDELRKKISGADALSRNLRSLQTELDAVRGELDCLKKSEADTSKELSILTVKADEIEKNGVKKKGYEKEVEGLRRNIQILEVIEDFCEKVPLFILDNILPIVEEEANKVLDEISSTGMRIEFRTEKVTKTTKAVRDTLDIIVSDVMGERPICQYSGGEKTRLVLALTVGLAELSSRKAGVKINTLVIDEPAGLDESGLKDFGRCVNKLVDAGMFETMLVVAHDKKLLEVFDQKIIVTKDGTSSRVEVLA
ncbi:MAG: SMC family ATPase [Nitrospiraceae bacterium]|nr:SMC family ATPase [Nitrospiraceae bacterium]